MVFGLSSLRLPGRRSSSLLAEQLFYHAPALLPWKCGGKHAGMVAAGAASHFLMTRQPDIMSWSACRRALKMIMTKPRQNRTQEKALVRYRTVALSKEAGRP